MYVRTAAEKDTISTHVQTTEESHKKYKLNANVKIMKTLKNNMNTTTNIFPSLLLALFIGLKLTDTIHWSWWWVLSPVWIPLCLVLIILALVLIINKK